MGKTPTLTDTIAREFIAVGLIDFRNKPMGSSYTRKQPETKSRSCFADEVPSISKPSQCIKSVFVVECGVLPQFSSLEVFCFSPKKLKVLFLSALVLEIGSVLLGLVTRI